MVKEGRTVELAGLEEIEVVIIVGLDAVSVSTWLLVIFSDTSAEARMVGSAIKRKIRPERTPGKS